MGVFNLDQMKQSIIMPQLLEDNNALCITKISDSNTFAVGTMKGVYIINDYKTTRRMLEGKGVLSVKLIGDNLICGTMKHGYFLLDIKNNTEKKLTDSKQSVISICLLSLIDANYSNLVLTLEEGSVNIINMVTGSIVKISDVPKTSFYTDSQMQIMNNTNDDYFSFVFIGKN